MQKCRKEEYREENKNSQCIGHGVRDTHKLGKNKGCLVRPLLANDILHRSRIHTISKGCDEGKIGYTQKCVKVVLFDSLVTIDFVRNCYSENRIEHRTRSELTNDEPEQSPDLRILR
jgi:hypothetical protein